MRVLIISNNDANLYLLRYELMERLLKEGSEVFVSAPAGSYSNAIAAMGCQYIESSFDRRGLNPLQELRLIGYYRAILSEIKPDVVLTYTIKPNVYGGMVCAERGVPYIANVTGLGTAVEKSGLLQRITVPLYRYGLRKAAMVFVQNTDNLRFLRDHRMISGPYELLPGSGVNLQKYAQREYPRGDMVDFVFVARIMKEKGINEYLEAAKAIRSSHPETRFHVCGPCEQDYSQILDELRQRGIIEYHGEVDDMVSMYSRCSCTVHPTFYPEGMSNVLLESCACGRPIITTDRAGCREIVEDGVNGFICRQQDSEDLIRQIERFLALTWEERRLMGINGRQKIEKEFDRSVVVEKYLTEIEKYDKSTEKTRG